MDAAYWWVYVASGCGFIGLGMMVVLRLSLSVKTVGSGVIIAGLAFMIGMPLFLRRVWQYLPDNSRRRRTMVAIAAAAEGGGLMILATGIVAVAPAPSDPVIWIPMTFAAIGFATAVVGFFAVLLLLAQSLEAPSVEE